tara:strand:- start:552 stop:1520 length:969 start_codon:yes stop_codon:yes gene_type:complete
MSTVKLTTTGGSGGSVSLKGPASTTSNADVELTLPVNDGDADQFLQTNGSGALSWADAGVDGISSSANSNAITIDSSEHVIVGGTTVSNVHAGNQDFVVGNTSNAQTGMALNCQSGGYISIVMTDGQGDKNKGLIAYNHADDTFKLVNDPASGYDTLVLQSDHDVKIGGGDLLFGTAGKGVVLGVTSNTDGNTLDDYEEGTWTPSISFNSGTTGIAYTTQSGHYTKVGNLVTCIFEIQLSNKGSSSGYMRIHGLPFAVVRRGAFNLGYYDTFNSSVTEPLIGLATSSTDIIPYQTGDSNSSDLTEAHFNNATRFFGTITYMA